MIAFRVDGNSIIGSGHVMRCLSVADALKGLGKSCIFITADDSMHSAIRNRGFEAVALGTEYDKMESETERLLEKVNEYHITNLVVDSYFVSDCYFESLKSIDKLTYVDDLIQKSYPVDTVINYNAYADSEEYKKLYRNSAVEFVLGAKYVPLRQEFAEVPDKKITKKVENVLVLTGGADPEHVALRFAEKAKNQNDGIHYRIVVGGLSKDLDSLREISKSVGNIEILSNISNMSEVMQQSDIAVSATGSTLYELFATGTPVITYVLADNQIKAASLLPEVYAGDARNNDHFIDSIFVLIDKLSSIEKRKELSEFERKFVDGKGAERIAKIL